MVVHSPPPTTSEYSFLVPKCKKDRDEKRPIVKYTEVLNSLSIDEWSRLKLPAPSSACPRPNLQCPDLVHLLPPVPSADTDAGGLPDVDMPDVRLAVPEVFDVDFSGLRASESPQLANVLHVRGDLPLQGPEDDGQGGLGLVDVAGSANTRLVYDPRYIRKWMNL